MGGLKHTSSGRFSVDKSDTYWRDRYGTPLAQVPAVLNGTVSRGSILIVDDEPAVAEMLRDIFMVQGYVVDGASNGGDAVMLASLSRPDAVT